MANGYTVGDLTLMPASTQALPVSSAVTPQASLVSQLDQFANQLKNSGVLLTTKGSTAGSSNTLGDILTNPMTYLVIAVVGGISYFLWNMGSEDRGRGSVYPRRYY